MGIAVAPFRNDHKLGAVIGNFAEEPISLYMQQKDPLNFLDEAQPSGIGPQSRRELKFGVFFFDYDLDGRLDVLAANGHLEPDIGRIKSEQTYKQPPQLFWNAGDDGDTEFVLAPPENPGEDFSRPMVGRGSAYADIDGDGDLDILITQCGGPPRLLRNDQKLGHHWARFILQSPHANRNAIGAKVVLHADGKEQERLISPTQGYLSQSELAATFGLNGADKIEKVVIRWPDGKVQEIASPAIDQVHRIEQK
jgi:hypothetical protein